MSSTLLLSQSGLSETKMVLENDNNEDDEIEICSFCKLPFPIQDDYIWACGVDEQECSVWCGKCPFSNLVLCSSCEYAVCPFHIHRDAQNAIICEHCISLEK